MIVEVPVPYEAIVVPPRSQNERRALLVAMIPMRIPPAGASLRVAAELSIDPDNQGRSDPMSRDGVVQFFTEGNGTLLERMPTCRVFQGTGADAGMLMVRIRDVLEGDFPLVDAMPQMTGGLHHAAGNLEAGLYWNPFQPAPRLTNATPFGVLAPETAPQRSIAPAPHAPSREQAIELAHEAAAAMRSLPDGRLLIPSVGPIWRFDTLNYANPSPVTSQRAVIATRARHDVRMGRSDVNWMWDVRGDRVSDMLGMCALFGCRTPTDAMLDRIKIMDPEAFTADDRSRGWATASDEFLRYKSPHLASMWGNPGRLDGGWATTDVMSAMMARDAVRAGDPYEAAGHCAELLTSKPELRGLGFFDSVEAHAKRLCGQWDAVPAPAALPSRA